MLFVATQYEQKILQETQVCINRTQKHTYQTAILRGVLKDFRV